jgi:hypothetical protein
MDFKRRAILGAAGAAAVSRVASAQTQPPIKIGILVALAVPMACATSNSRSAR